MGGMKRGFREAETSSTTLCIVSLIRFVHSPPGDGRIQRPGQTEVVGHRMGELLGGSVNHQNVAALILRLTVWKINVAGTQRGTKGFSVERGSAHLPGFHEAPVLIGSCTNAKLDPCPDGLEVVRQAHCLRYVVVICAGDQL